MKIKFLSLNKGSALVTTLMIVVVISIIVVAFLQSMSIERNVARSYAAVLQAKLLADTAEEIALTRLSRTMDDGPYSAVFAADASNSPYPFFAKRDLSTNGVSTQRIPLFSTQYTNESDFDSFDAPFIQNAAWSVSDRSISGASATRSLTNAGDRVFDINSPTSDFPGGLIGLSQADGSRVNLPVNWIYVSNADGRVVGRYAFWVDDELSKIDLRTAGQSSNTSGTHTRTDGSNLDEISLLAFTNAPVNATTSGDIAALLDARTLTNSFDFRAAWARYATNNGSLTDAAWEKIRPLVSVYGLEDDRSYDGKRKINLNEIVGSPDAKTEVLAIRDALTNNIPQFGQRYYSQNNGTDVTVSPENAATYATKIAANIRDFIDADSSATVLTGDPLDDSSINVRTGVEPGFIPFETQDSDLPIAFGKEQGPFLSEYLMCVRVINPTVTPPTSSSTLLDVTVRFAHYIELHNPTGKTITYNDLRPNPYVLLSNRGIWNNKTDTSSLSPTPPYIRPADIKMNLPTNFSIPPGGYAVITTDGPPWQDEQSGFIGPATNRYVVNRGTGPGTWELINTGGKTSPTGANYEDYDVKMSTASSNRYALQKNIDAGTTYADQRERLLFGNDNALIDFTMRIFTTRNVYAGRGVRNPSWMASFLSDNQTSSNNSPSSSNTEPRITRGDVRSNTEVSKINFDPPLSSNSGSSWKDGQSSYGTPSSQSTIGTTNYNTSQSLSGVDLYRQGWYEYTSDAAENHFVLNKNLASIAQLGSLYDPVRYDINGFRSQGATLRIGQPDDPSNNRANSTSSTYTAWLGGRGANDPSTNNYDKNAFHILDNFRTDDRVTGRINPNSLIRDPSGIVFEALLNSFTFESAATNQASSALSGRTLNVQNSLNALQSFFRNSTNGFLVSVGDLGRSPIFSGTNTDLAGISMVPVSDAGREEFFRRTGNLMTTQSLAFTVFIRAQAGEFTENGTFKIRANATREVVLQLVPEYSATSDPLVPEKPVRWHIERPRAINH
ncbi:MAG: PilX N-terminal domain-containing pilus assembly protein [Chthoniobacterales bacterium]